jgi:hypothetical protein
MCSKISISINQKDFDFYCKEYKTVINKLTSSDKTRLSKIVNRHYPGAQVGIVHLNTLHEYEKQNTKQEESYKRFCEELKNVAKEKNFPATDLL